MLNYKAVLGTAALAVGAMSGLTSQAGSAEPMFFYFFYYSQFFRLLFKQYLVFGILFYSISNINKSI